MISIKSEEEISKMKKAGHINYLTHQYLKSLIKPGITTKYLSDEADKFIRSHGGIHGFLGLYGFPGSICVSVNEEIVHGIPGDKVLKEGDIVSLDIGVLLDGYHSDSAWTYPVGKISKEKEYLIKTREVDTNSEDLAREKIKEKFKKIGTIISQKVLKKEVNNSTIEYRVFVICNELISEYKYYEKSDANDTHSSN